MLSLAKAFLVQDWSCGADTRFAIHKIDENHGVVILGGSARDSRFEPGYACDLMTNPALRVARSRSGRDDYSLVAFSHPRLVAP